MGEFVYFTEEQKQRANAVDLEDFLSRQGEKLLRSGREKRLASDHSITVRGNRWYDHATEKGGCAIDFVRMFYNQSFPDAVTMLLGGEQGVAYRESANQQLEPKKPFVLPEANQTMHRAFAYLIKTRCMDPKVVSVFAGKHMIYEDVKYHNVVFVGFDDKNEAKFAACSNPESFNAHLDAINDPYFVACLDLGHAEMRGLDTSAVEMIEKLGSRLQALHIHDNDLHHDSHQIPFSMQIDFEPIVKALKAIHYDGYFTLEADQFMKAYNRNNAFDGVKLLAESARKLADMYEKA